MPADFDEVLEELGHFGRYQQINYVLFFLPVFLYSAFTLTFVFTTGEPNYRCFVPECEEWIVPRPYLTPWIANAVPKDKDGKLENCMRYAVKPYAEWGNVSCPSDRFLKNITWSCHDFVFEGKEVTLVNEFNLTCAQNKWKLTLVGTINSAGQFFGLPIAGFISDRFGRRTVMVGAMVLTSICGMVKSFAPNYPTFVTIEFLESLIGSGIYPAAFILALELVGSSHRAFGAMFLSIAYTLGVAYSALVAWALSNWKNMILTLYTPGIIFVSYFWIVPESVRWLMAHGDLKAAGHIVCKAAGQNGVTLSETVLSIFRSTVDEKKKSEVESILEKANPGSRKIAFKSLLRDIVTSQRLVFRLVINCICWMNASVVFYGLSIGAVNLFGDKYLNFVMTALAGIPGSIIPIPAMEKMGRRSSLVLFFILSAVACGTVPFLPSDGNLYWLPISLYVMGKVMITAAFTILYTYSSEMFPTNLRSSSLSTCSTFARIGSMLAPQAPLLAIYEPCLQYVVFASSGLLAGCLSLLLPETMNAKLPDTVSEAEELGRTPLRSPQLR